MVALMVFGCFGYLLATEYISAKKSKGEIHDRINSETLAQEKTIRDSPASIHRQTGITSVTISRSKVSHEGFWTRSMVG